MSSRILITAPLPPASGSSIGEPIGWKHSGRALNASNSQKLGNFQTALLGEFMSGTHRLGDAERIIRSDMPALIGFDPKTCPSMPRVGWTM